MMTASDHSVADDLAGIIDRIGIDQNPARIRVDAGIQIVHDTITPQKGAIGARVGFPHDISEIVQARSITAVRAQVAQQCCCSTFEEKCFDAEWRRKLALTASQPELVEGVQRSRRASARKRAKIGQIVNSILAGGELDCVDCSGECADAKIRPSSMIRIGETLSQELLLEE